MITEFHALTNGVVKSYYEWLENIPLRTVELGVLSVPSGKLGVGDSAYHETEIDIVPGDYKIVATVADVSEDKTEVHDRVAYLSLIVSDGETEKLVNAIDDSEENDTFGVGVDSGTVGFSDFIELDKLLDLIDFDFDKIDDEASDGKFGVWTQPSGKTYLIYSSSGWGDGFYPVVKTLDKNNQLTGIHVDFQIVGQDDNGTDEEA